MSEATKAVAGIIMAVIGLAIVAVLVGSQAKTSDVINAGGSALSNVIKNAVAPVVSSGGFGAALPAG